MGAFYGLAELGINCVEVFFRLHLLVFYTNVVGLNPALAGLALGLAIFWDALIDPIVGAWSDRSRQKKGHRSQWILIGIVAVCFSLFVLLNPPTLNSDFTRFAYLLMGALFFNTSYTLLSVPYSAIVGDITSTERQRARLIGWRLAFANLGGIAGIAIPSYFLIQKSASAYSQTGFVIGALVILSCMITWLYVSHQPKKKSDLGGKRSWAQAFGIPFKDKGFMPLVMAYFVGNIGLTFNTSLALYYYRLRLKLSEQDIQSVLLVFLFVFTLSIPLWLWLSKRYPKKKVMILGVFLLGLVTGFTYPFLPVSDLVPVLIWASTLGGVFVGASVLLESLLTDIVKNKEAETHEDLMGLYFGFWKMVGKISRGIALALTGQLLAWSGVAGHSLPTDGDFPRLAISFGPIVAIFFIASAGILWHFRTSLA